MTTTVALCLLIAQADYDPKVVEELVEAYEDLGPTRVPELEGKPALGLQQVLRSAQFHPSALGANAAVEGAMGSQTAAAGGFDPKLSAESQGTPTGYYDVDSLDAKLSQPTPLWGTELFVGYRIGRSTDFALYDPRETLDGGEIRAGLRLPLLADGWIDQRRADLRTADLRRELAEAERDRVRLMLAVDGADAYWTWVSAGTSLRVLLNLFALAERQRSQIEVLVRNGAAPEVFRAENLQILLTRRDAVVEGIRKLEKSAIKLSLFFRNPDGNPVLPSSASMPRQMPLPSNLDEEAVASGIEKALEARPELVVIDRAVSAARVEAQLADNQILPKLDFKFAASQDFGNDPSELTQKSLEPFEIKAILELEFPLLLRKGRGKAEKAWAKVRELSAKQVFAIDKVRSQIQDLGSLYRRTATRARVADQAAKAAEAVAAAERAKLVSGATSPFKVNLREQKAAETRQKAIKAQAEHLFAKTAWEFSTMARRP